MRYLLILIGIGATLFGIFAVTGNPAPGLFALGGEIRVPEKISSEWGKALNPEGIVPVEGFRAIYFSRGDSSRVVFQENVESVAIKYAWSDFHGIDSPSFAAYWVGQLNFDKPARKQISVSQSWAKSRILINGEVIFDGRNSGDSIVHDFQPGQHIVEVEYSNNWHTTEFKVTIQDEVQSVTEDELIDYFHNGAAADTNVYYAGLYESAAKDTAVDIAVPSVGKPVILWLSSYEAVDWNISAGDDVAAVVVQSYSRGSTVSGAGEGRVMYLKGWGGVNSETRRCSCSGGHFHCEEKNDLEDVAEQLSAVTGQRLSGYAVEYSARSLAMRSYGKDVIDRIQRKRASIAEVQQQCEGEADPDFDSAPDDW